MKKSKKLLSMLLCLIMLVGLLPVVGASAAPSRLEVLDAYYMYLKADIASFGNSIQDQDYYKMLTNKASNAKTQNILACYLKDVTNDGMEELIIKRYVTHSSSAMIDFSDTEWVCIYTYDNGKIRRIGQNRDWAKVVGNGSWSYYEPAGFIGDILSSYEYPYISDDCVYYCIGDYGTVYLADMEPANLYDETCRFYKYNGSVMAEARKFRATFVNDYWYGIQLNTGSMLYEIDGEKVSYDTFYDEMDRYTSGGWTKLTNNGYSTVLNQLKNETISIYTPSKWAKNEVNAAIDRGYVPERIQKSYTKPITRAEFCALATNMYESITGMEIAERMEFNDTTDVNVQKMGGLEIVNGTGGGNFSPNANLTRQEAATILARMGKRLAMQLQNGTLSYADSDKVAKWARTSVATISASGVMKGVENNCFNPTGSYTREQAIMTIYRLSNVPIGDPILVTGLSLNKTTLGVTMGQSATLTATVTPADATDKLVYWSSSNTGVVKVSNTGVLTTVDEGTAVITAETNSGHKATCTVTVNPVKATAITLNKTTAFANVGRTVQLTPIFTPSNASTKHTTWTSSNPAVATVSSKGVVTAVSEGTTVITAEAFGKKATCNFTVSSAPLGLANFEKVKTYGNQFTDVATNVWYYKNVKTAFEYDLMNGMTATTFAPGDNLTIAQAIVIACRIHDTYHGNNASFKKPSGAAWYQGYVNYAVDNGIINAGDYADYNKNATRMQFAQILANSVPAEALSAINNVGNGIPDVPPEMAGADAVYLLYNAGILTGSSAYGNFNPNSNIVRSEVAAIITRIADPSLRKKFTLQPTTIPATALAMDRGAIGMIVGDTVKLGLAPTPSNATTKNVKWTSSNTSVATVDSSGNVKAKGAGSATITATLGSFKATCQVGVLASEIKFDHNSSYEDKQDITLPKGAYYIEYTKESLKNFKASTIWNWGLGDSEIISDYSKNTGGRGIIAKAIEESTTMDLTASGSGNWTAKICPINEVGSTNIKGTGHWVGGIFRAEQGKYNATIKSDNGYISVIFCRVDQYGKVSVWDIEDDGSASVTLVEGGYYVPVIDCVGNWTVDLGVGGTLQTVN